MIDGGKDSISAHGGIEISEFLIVKLFFVVHSDLGGTQNGRLHFTRKFLHHPQCYGGHCLCLYSTTMKAYLRLSYAMGSGLMISRSHLWRGHVWAINFVKYEGAPLHDESFWQVSHERAT